MPVSLPEWENDVIFSKRQACIQSKVGPLKSSYSFWGSAISSSSGVYGGAMAEIEHLKHCPAEFSLGVGGGTSRNSAPRLLQWRGTQTMDHDFLI